MDTSRCADYVSITSYESLQTEIADLRRQLAEAKEAEKCAYDNADSTLNNLIRACEKKNNELADVTAERDRLRNAATKVDKQEWDVALLSGDQCEALDDLEAALRREE